MPHRPRRQFNALVSLRIEEIRYFFYITNDRTLSNDEVVREANKRCNQENLIEQLKNGVRALHAPVNTLNANWVYMVMASLAWSLKAWVALTLPIHARWRQRHVAEQLEDGVPHIPGSIHQRAGADRARGSTAHLSVAFVEPLAACLLSVC